MAKKKLHNITKARIVQIATRRFLQTGYSGTSVKSISDELGISTGHLTFYYPTKEHLLSILTQMLCDFQWKMMTEQTYRGEDGVGATFPGGITVYGTTLNEILGEGAAYWQGNTMVLPADDATEITGGDVVIKAYAAPSGWTEIDGDVYTIRNTTALNVVLGGVYTFGDDGIMIEN